jgi:hypothetical protein
MYISTVVLYVCAFRVGNVHRLRGYALEEMDRLSPNVFKRMFRVDRATFDEILERVSPFVGGTQEQKAINSSGTAIPTKTKLALTLRWLAGASYLDLCFAFGVATSTFYHPRGVLWPIMEAIDAAFSIGFPFNDANALETLSRGFEEHSSGILKGCVMAIDGFGVSTRQPFKYEVDRPRDYRFRKGGFAIVVLAGCDVKARFVSASCNHSGSTNDIIAWNDSKLFTALEVEKRLPSQYFFIGDEAFTNTSQFLSPWPGNFFFVFLLMSMLHVVLIFVFFSIQVVALIGLKIHLTIGFRILDSVLNVVLEC